MKTSMHISEWRRVVVIDFALGFFEYVKNRRNNKKEIILDSETELKMENKELISKIANLDPKKFEEFNNFFYDFEIPVNDINAADLHVLTQQGIYINIPQHDDSLLSSWICMRSWSDKVFGYLTIDTEFGATPWWAEIGVTNNHPGFFSRGYSDKIEFSEIMAKKKQYGGNKQAMFEYFYDLMDKQMMHMLRSAMGMLNKNFDK
jgi:hypothetical protein